MFLVAATRCLRMKALGLSGYGMGEGPGLLFLRALLFLRRGGSGIAGHVEKQLLGVEGGIAVKDLVV